MGIRNKVLFCFAVLSAVAATLTIQSVDLAYAGDESCQTPVAGGGGEGGIPSPFTFNEKVELADGEAYILMGRVTILPTGTETAKISRVSLEVDLDEHPWLASSKRKEAPRYLIEGAVTRWKKFDGTRILLKCVARGRIHTIDGVQQYVITLRPLEMN